MQLTVEPPLNKWQVGVVDGGLSHDRAGLFDLINANAQRLGSGALSGQSGKGDGGNTVIATGHQAWLWHPGILAKDLAMTVAAARMGAGMFHVVVDQDAHAALQLDLPVIRNKQLSIESVSLGPDDPAIPTACRSSVAAEVITSNLLAAKRRLGDSLAGGLTGGVAEGIDGVIEAFGGTPSCVTLAEQLTVALARLRRLVGASSGDDGRGWGENQCGTLPVVFVSQLTGLSFYQAMLDRMLNDAQRCVSCYNRAAAGRPDAGILPLRVERDRVELPLWLLRWGKPRQRVFADLAGDPALFTLENGQPIEGSWSPDGGWGSKGWGEDRSGHVLAPRALLLTAVLRRYCCDLFIHGKGGLVYDRVTEVWWQDWLGEALAPMTAVSADLRLEFDVPISDEQAVRDAQWWLHHLPHNIDRLATIPTPLNPTVAEKRAVLSHMDDDRDSHRRARAFKRVHQINRNLVEANPAVITEARRRLEQAQIGVANQQIAGKRDWCFGLYDPAVLSAIIQALNT